MKLFADLFADLYLDEDVSVLGAALLCATRIGCPRKALNLQLLFDLFNQ